MRCTKESHLTHFSINFVCLSTFDHITIDIALHNFFYKTKARRANICRKNNNLSSLPVTTMARYTNAALACALSLLSLNGSSAWTTSTSSDTIMKSMRSNINSNPSPSALSAFRSKVVDDPYASLESAMSIVSPTSTSKSLSGVTLPSIELPSVHVPSSIFEPIQTALSQIIETEKALNNMEHTAVSNVAKTLLEILNSFDESYASFASSILAVPIHTLQEIVTSSVEAAKATATSIDDILLANAVLGPIVSTIQEKALALSPIIGEELASLPPSVGILVTAEITFLVITTVLSIGEGPPPSSPYPLGRYDPSSARQYFDNRLGDVIGRAVQIGGLSAKFALGILKDYSDNKMEENADLRGKELAVLLTNLGPTFSK